MAAAAAVVVALELWVAVPAALVAAAAVVAAAAAVLVPSAVVLAALEVVAAPGLVVEVEELLVVEAEAPRLTPRPLHPPHHLEGGLRSYE